MHLQLPLSPFFYPILDAGLSTDLAGDARDVIRAGARILQVRAKKQTKKWIYEKMQEIIPLCNESNACCLIDDCVDIALVTDGAGVHLGQLDFPVREARALLGSKVIGFSTHNMDQFLAAGDLPADYVTIGPVFPTGTKENADPALGIQEVAKIVRNKTKPVVAIGGILPEQIPSLIQCGVDGIAVISALYRNGNLYDNARRMLEKIVK